MISLSRDLTRRSAARSPVIAGFALILVVMTIAGCSDDSDSGGGALADLAAGDCVTGVSAAEGNVPDIEQVDCADGEAEYRVRKLVVVETSGDEFPGDEFLRTFAGTTCGDDSLPSVVPTRQRWQSGDRMIVCLSEL